MRFERNLSVRDTRRDFICGGYSGGKGIKKRMMGKTKMVIFLLRGERCDSIISFTQSSMESAQTRGM